LSNKQLLYGDNNTPGLLWVAIGDSALDGHFKLVRDDVEFAVAKWSGSHWCYSNGHNLEFQPKAFAIFP